ncbi:MAG: PadR family transcriptional regulator [Planctomycetota bacterium]|jgi:DNA-binding PadR family transcriptional regulator
MNLDTILLALLREPTSGYDLKAAFDGAANHFWPAELSQIYRTLKRLEKAGLLRSRMEPSGRGPDRRVYRRSAAGRRALHEQLAEDPEFGDERLAYIAQLFFLHELNDLEATRACVEKVRAKRQRQLGNYRTILKERMAACDGSLDDATDEIFHQYLTLEAGMTVAKARLRWCDDTIKLIDRRIQAKKRKTGGPRSKKS